MTCDEAEILLHALIDGELDAGHARAVEEHVAGCPRCAAELAAYREMSKATASANLRYTAPPALRRRIEASLPQARVPNRRAVLRGFAMGSAVSAIAASGLFAILRNVCRAEYARRASSPTAPIEDVPEDAAQTPLWHDAPETPEAQMLHRWDASTIRRLVEALAEPFRETFVLREIHELSYREIADVVGAPVGTVMSRLARARAMLRSAWMAEDK